MDLNTNYRPPLLSRITLIVTTVLVVGAIFMFVSRAFEPAPLPQVAPAKKAEAFNPKADVSKHIVFGTLETSTMQDVPDLPVGRNNPFLSLDATGTAEELSATNTEELPVGKSKIKMVLPVESTNTAL